MRRHLFAAMGVALLVLGAIPPAWGLRANPTATRTATAGAVGVEVTTPATPTECAGMTFAQTLVGTAGDDIITAGNNGTLIFGLGGNDTIHGGNGEDCLVGGDGEDQLYGEHGKDVLLGGANDDHLYGGEGKDYLDGGAGTDWCEAVDSGGGVRINCEAPP
jgi:Ca2+-binding RTX toxin-like protein